MKHFPITIILVILIFGCGKPSTIRELASAVDRDKLAKILEPQVNILNQTKALFPETVVNVGPIRGGLWRAASQSLLFGRYKFIVTQTISVSPDQKNVVSVQSAEFQFFEISIARSNRIDGIEVYNNCGLGEKVVITKAKWDQLVVANGDFESLGICLITNKPVAKPQDVLIGL